MQIGDRPCGVEWTRYAFCAAANNFDGILSVRALHKRNICRSNAGGFWRDPLFIFGQIYPDLKASHAAAMNARVFCWSAAMNYTASGCRPLDVASIEIS